MKKLIFAIAFTAISIVAVQAQSDTKKTTISVGVEAGFPVGSAGLGDVYSFAIGGSLEAEYLVSPDFGLTLKAGYLDYLAKGGFADIGFIPVLVGFRYHFTPKVYGAAQLGISFPTLSGGGSFFSYAPGLGFQLSHHADLFLRYEAASKSGFTYGNVGVRLAYSFN